MWFSLKNLCSLLFNSCYTIFDWTELGSLVLDTHNPDMLIYTAGYWIKIKLTKDGDKLMISISTIQEFPALTILIMTKNEEKKFDH